MNPSLEVVMGGMFSGKTTYLVNKINQEKRRAQVGYFRFTLQELNSPSISSCEFKTHDSTALKIPSFLAPLNWSFQEAQCYQFVVLDEIQFLDSGRIDLVRDLVEKHEKRVLVSGLDMDFMGEPFDTTVRIAAIADRVTKLHSICDECGKDAVYSQKTSGSHSRLEEGGSDKYRPLCRQCYCNVTSETL